MIFRNAQPHEAEALTQLTLASKEHWGYPEEWMALWIDDLTITLEYIGKNMVAVAEEGGELLGYISIKESGTDNFSLDNLFIHPSHIRKGIGEKLLAIGLDWCKENQVAQLHIYSDPYSRGFYEKMGAAYVGEIPSEVIPDRTLPHFIYHFA